MQSVIPNPSQQISGGGKDDGHLSNRIWGPAPPAVKLAPDLLRRGRRAACAALVLMLALTVFVRPVGAQSSVVPPGNAPGAPVGSYLLSGVETLSLYSGKVNAVVPLVKVGGRGDAGYTMMLKIEDASWTTHHEFDNGLIYYVYPEPREVRRSVFVQPFEFGTMAVRHTAAGMGCNQPDSDGPPTCFESAAVTMVFTEADGTEHALYDELTGGQPSNLQPPYWNSYNWVPGTDRGLLFSAKDGSGLTFVADPPMFSEQYYAKVYFNEYDAFSPGFREEPVSGYLKTKDGTVVRFLNARAQWIRDRNGNLTTFHYQAAGGGHIQLVKVIDSNNRATDIIYSSGHPQIVYKGAHGQPRTIDIYSASLQSRLLPGRGYTTGPIYQLFPVYPQFGSPGAFANRNDLYNPGVTSAVTLPDGRSYNFYYNQYGELARIEAPAGAAVEYDYGAGLEPDPNLGHFPSGQVGKMTTFGPQIQAAIYRRLLERREYANGGTAVTRRTTYSRYVTGAPRGNVREEHYDPVSNNALVARQDHYFNGIPHLGLISLQAGPIGLGDLLEGRETKTESLALGGDTVLARTVYEWDAGCGGSRSYCAGASRPWSAFLKSTTASVLETSTGQYKVSRQTFTYDTHDNLTDTYEYHYGNGQPGPLARRSHTDYANSANLVNGADYAALNIHLRGLPVREQIFNAVGVERARTTYEYDKYLTDDNHAGLLDRASISGLCTTFDAAGQCSSANSPDYKTRGNVTAVTVHVLPAGGSFTSYAQYDVAGNVVKSIDGRGHASTVEFADRYGSPDGEARGNTAPQELNSLFSYAFATLVTNSLGHQTYTQYDYHAGLPVNAEDPNGAVVSTEYDDDLDRATRSVRAVGTALAAQTTTTYNDSAHTVTVTSDLNNYEDNLLKSESVYDGMGRTTEGRAYEGGAVFITKATSYDALGRVKTVSNPYRTTTEPTYGVTDTSYDALGRVETVTAPDGTVMLSEYDGTKTMVTDPAGNRRVSETNALGQLTDLWEVTAAEPTTVTLPFGGQNLTAYLTHYSYDTLGNLTQVTQGAQTRSYAYDSLSRLTSATNPESGTFQYQYDANGNLILKIDPRPRAGGALPDCSIPYPGGQVASCIKYDALNRVESQDYNDGTPAVAYTYDASGANSKGRMTSVSSSVSTYSFTAYDALGRVKASSQTVDGIAYAMPDYRYNLAGRLTSQQYPSGRVVATEYDDAGRVAGVKNAANGSFYVGAAATDVNNSVQYAAHGPASAARLGNGLWEHSAYNPRLQPTQIALGSSRTDAGVLRLDYAYGVVVNGTLDPSKNNGNVQSQTITAPGLPSALTLAYTYDAMNRLTSARETKAAGGQENWKQTYTYLDAGNQHGQFGNRRLDAAGTTSNVMPAHNPTINPANNRYADGQGFGYDPAGNLTAAPGRTYQYDADGRMKTLDGGVTTSGGASYHYDGQGRRVKKVEPARTTVYVYDASGRPVAEYSNYSTGSGTKYLTQDAMRSTRVVTRQDGGVESRHDYLPFGEEVNVSAVTTSGREAVASYNYGLVTRKFATYERDAESGLDYAVNRYYSSTAGRFTSPDPTVKSIVGLNPQTLNRYAYVVNNPLLFIDPNGLWGIYYKQITDEDGRFKRFEIYLVKTKKDDNAASLVKQLGFSTKDGKDLEKKIDKMLTQGEEIRGSKLGGIVGRTYEGAEYGLTKQTLYDLKNPGNKNANPPLGGHASGYDDCSMTSCRIAYPGQTGQRVLERENNPRWQGPTFGIQDADEFNRGRDLKPGDSLRAGDIVRYGKGKDTHFVNMLLIDDDGVTQVFSRSGGGGVFETLTVDEPKLIDGYGPVTGKFRP